MPKVTVMGQGDKPKVKWNYSTFFLTINTNQQAYATSKLKKRLTELFENDDDFYLLFKNRPGTEGGVESIDREDAKIQMAIEVGPKSKKVHAHVLIRVRHHGNIQFDKAFTDDVIKKLLGVDGIYINIKGSGASILTLEEYIS